jgi:hypothetical protein
MAAKPGLQIVVHVPPVTNLQKLVCSFQGTSKRMDGQADTTRVLSVYVLFIGFNNETLVLYCCRGEIY